MKNPFPSLVLAALVVAFLSTGCVFVVGSDGDFEASTAWSDEWRPERYTGSGVAGSQAREVADFREVCLRGSADVVVRAGTEKGVVVSCDDNLLERVETRVEDGVLVVQMLPGSYRFRRGLKVEIGTRELVGVRLDGSGNIDASGLSGSELALGLSGSGNVRAAGQVESLSVSVSGSGDVALDGLAARHASVAIAGSGDVLLSASEALDVSISGSGDVRYRGSPAVRKNIAGSGTVRPVP